MIKNTQKTQFYIWVLAIALSVFTVIYKSRNFRINSSDGAFILISLTFFLTSLIFIRVSYRNFKMIDNAIKENKMIVHWKYTSEEWKDYIEHEYNYRSGEGQLLTWFLSAFTILIFGLFILFIPEGKFFMFIVMLCLICMYIFMGYALPYLIYLFRSRTGEVVIMKKGVLLNKTFHTWGILMSKLNNVEIIKTPYHHISLTYSFIDRTGPRDYTIHIPIPKNNKNNLNEIIKKLK